MQTIDLESRGEPDGPETTALAAPDRGDLAAEIFARLEQQQDELKSHWSASGPINYFVVDDLLPEAWAIAIHRAFPDASTMMLKRSLREHKYVAAQMDRYHPLLEESIYAFQAPEVVRIIERITGLSALEPDSLLYAGGVSLMAPGHFLNPHVDNSHDMFRLRYRVLNLLYYVTPGWSEAQGGNLELWPDGPRGDPHIVVSRFNRLVVMVTHCGSWHSVSRNISSENRCCVSNYYFSQQPIGGKQYFHVTSFRGRPEEKLRDLALRGDITLRMWLRKFFPTGVRKNPHFYRRKP